MSNFDWQIPKGETDSLLIQVLNDGTPVDITDSTIYFTVKKLDSDTDSAAVIEKNITEHVDAINGQSRLELTSADTNIQKDRYLYDLVIVFLSGERQHLIPPSYFEITSTIKGI